MKLLIQYIILSYPLMALVIWIRYKEYKAIFTTMIESNPLMKMGFTMGKAFFDKSSLKKKLKSPSFFIPIVVLAIVGTPIVIPFLFIDEIQGLVKKGLKKFKKEKILLPFRAVEAIPETEEMKSIWVIERHLDGEWIRKTDFLFTDEILVKNQVKVYNEMYVEGKKKAKEKFKSNEVQV